jgi:hypothetical protein
MHIVKKPVMSKKKKHAKFTSPQLFIGREGVQLIQRVLTTKRWLMTETTQESDGGIDGYIEICDPGTGERTNLTVKVQSKATTLPWQAETADSFEYLVKEADLNYWLRGNGPVILVLTRPKDNEAYWVSIRDYFRTVEAKRSRRIVVDKKRDRFDVATLDKLMELASEADTGIYFSPPKIREQLMSNLLPLQNYPEKIFIAETKCPDGASLALLLKAKGIKNLRCWFHSGGRIVTFHDLHDSAWNDIVDRGTIDCDDVSEWSRSLDPTIQRDFVRLLNATLQDQLGGLGIWRERSSGWQNVYYFGPDRETIERKRRWTKSQNQSVIHLVMAVHAKAGHIVAYRHRAFAGQFRAFGGEWYLVVDPTYHFTSDGKKTSRFGESYLTGMKRLEKNAAVDGNLRLWVDLFTAPNLFERSRERLSFKRPISFEAELGIPESAWSALNEEKDFNMDIEDDAVHNEMVIEGMTLNLFE